MSRTLHPFDTKRNGPLPPKQQQVYDFIVEMGWFPTLHQIAKHMNWASEQSAYDCLCRMEWRGKVKRTYAKGDKGVRWVLVSPSEKRQRLSASS